MNPFRKGRNLRATNKSNVNKLRRTSDWKIRRAKLRAGIGSVNVKNSLDCALLNVDGLSDESLVDVQNTLDVQKPDICFLLETKRRFEDVGPDIAIDCYDLF